MTVANGSAETAQRRCQALGVALTLALGATAAASAEPLNATYPPSRALPDIARWLGSDTPLQLSQVVDVGPSAVTAVTSATPTGSPRGFKANISAEALDPAIGRQEEIVSWTIPVDVDCEKRQVRLGDMTGYPSRDLHSAPRIVRASDNTWVTPSPNAPLGAVLRALCDRDFRRPFSSGAKVASKPAEPPKPAKTTGPPPVVLTESPPTAPQPLSSAVTRTAKAAPAPASAPAATHAPAAAAAAKVGHGASAAAVQVGASPSQDDAKGLLARVQKKFPEALAGFKTEVQTAQVEGKTVYRAVISGFAGQGDAIALCDQLKAAGQACFVRR